MENNGRRGRAARPLANLLPCDNIFAIEEVEWYKDNPLVIRGPGAGRAAQHASLNAAYLTYCKIL